MTDFSEAEEYLLRCFLEELICLLENESICVARLPTPPCWRICAAYRLLILPMSWRTVRRCPPHLPGQPTRCASYGLARRDCQKLCR